MTRGENLRALRVSRNYSLEALADLSGITNATLSRLENNLTTITFYVLDKLCKAYGMNLVQLVIIIEQ